MARGLRTAAGKNLAQPRWTSAFQVGSGAAWLLMLIGIPVLLVGLEGSGMIDLAVYRTGGRAWLEDLSLYAKDFPGTLGGPRLPFTYPPIAAVIFGGLAVMPLWVAKTLICAGTFLALSGTCWAVTAKFDLRTGIALPLAGTAAVLAVLSQPFRSTLDFGQVNAFLMVLVAVDCLAVRDRRFRGILVGLAAAIKLTPAIFVLYFILRRDWRAAITTFVSFVAFSLLGFALAPRDTMNYWFDALLDPSRVGGLAYAYNQSLRGVLHRFDPPASVESLLWAGLAVAVLVVAWQAGKRAVNAGNDVGALVAIATAGLLVSPVSWAHHWVWIAPAMLLVGWSIWRANAWRLVPFALAACAIFYIGPFEWLPQENNRELDWSVWEIIIGNSYAWLGIVLLVVMAYFWRYSPSEAAPAVVDEDSTPTAQGSR
ncbi:glycosyltransferase 87 family protein [Antrihabitans sp. YC2-6]|uniref:glycosyltransferase 87 family protein n=1 Tax=Antrihabitans sp. YC2-6 TaxID=2799498 RepID=UPI0018F562DE|nr:glycosyltransferase 87 family protein [Antrihabitans sp. YC2-6]MBJ8343234.1 DUF2029 domain-containing protein [Antrihabitans sp. YC2-6]